MSSNFIRYQPKYYLGFTNLALSKLQSKILKNLQSPLGIKHNLLTIFKTLKFNKSGLPNLANLREDVVSLQKKKSSLRFSRILANPTFAKCLDDPGFCPASIFYWRRLATPISGQASNQPLFAYSKNPLARSFDVGSPYMRALKRFNQKKIIKKHLYTKRGSGNLINTLSRIFNKRYITYNLETYQRSNQDTCLIQKPTIKEGDWVQTGDLLADSASSMGGELAIGHNIIVAYMPWEGYNYEDAILINERLVYDDIYTSIHIERYEVSIKDTKLGFEQITREIPETNEHEVSHLDRNGIAKIGSWVEEGDILVGKITPFNIKTLTPQQKLLYKIFDKEVNTTKDTSLRAPKGILATVINVNILAFKTISSIEKKVLKTPKTKLLKKKDKMNKQRKDLGEVLISGQKQDPKGRHSLILAKDPLTKFVDSGALSRQRLDQRFSSENLYTKRLSSISPLSRILNKFGIDLKKKVITSNYEDTLSRLKHKPHKEIKNLHIYLAEKRKIQIGDKIAGRHGNKGIISKILPRQDMPFLPDGTSVDIVLNPLGVPSRMNVGQIYECLLGLAGRFLGEQYKIPPFDESYGADASRTFVLAKLYEARKKTGLKWLFDPNNPGKIRLFDGRNSECFDQTITVGIAYVLKLVHMVDDKMHMRSTGPYSLVTQQPLRGRSKQGGQRLGEMEVWAIEGYGAAFVLSEMLTIKSDDMTGRQNLWKNLIENNDISLGSPESFKVLVCELQALCLDIGLFRYNKTKLSEKSLIEIESLLHLA